MLGTWRSHADYQRFMVLEVNRIFKHNPKAIAHYETAILKMYHLNLDSVKEDFAALFALDGRPSNQQPEVFRSFVLMSHFKMFDFAEWVGFARATPIICALIGVTPDTMPGVGTHYDFLNRLWCGGEGSSLKSFSRKPKEKYGKDKKPPKHPGIVRKLAQKAIDGTVFKAIPERLLQAIFAKTAVLPSAKMGLLGNISKLIISGDGTCVETGGSQYGRRVCACQDHCSCKRRFGDPDATWGWDSYHETYYYGYTAYLLSVNNPDLKLDLPIYMRFVEASRHDSVSLIASLAHARHIYKDVFTFDGLLADSAHDNYPTYELCQAWDIKPFIDLNPRTKSNENAHGILLVGGKPVCADGYEMVFWGYDKLRHRLKYRCPLALGKIDYCPYWYNCSSSNYGKTIYLKTEWDIRQITPVPRDSEEWKDTYKQRSGAERVNDRVFIDYDLENAHRRGKKRIAALAFFNAINVHLDAQVKHGTVALSDFLQDLAA